MGRYTRAQANTRQLHAAAGGPLCAGLGHGLRLAGTHEAKLARCALEQSSSMGLRRVRRTCTAARMCFKGGLRSKPPSVRIRGS